MPMAKPDLLGCLPVVVVVVVVVVAAQFDAMLVTCTHTRMVKHVVYSMNAAIQSFHFISFCCILFHE